MTTTLNQPSSTTTYSLFKKHSSNRVLNNSNLNRIKNSVKLCNRLRYYPIVVDADMRVIDGQHRLEAAKTLGVPVFYTIIKDATTQDIIMPNTAQKGWMVDDFVNFYKNEGNEDYKKLDEFMQKYHHTTREALLLLKGRLCQKDRVKFKDGMFKFPDQNAIARALELRDHIEDVKIFLCTKFVTNENRHILKNLNFQYALLEFFSAKSVDFNVFMKKLEMKLDCIRPCTSRTNYIDLFKQIYNYMNKNPIEIDNT